MYFTCVGGLLSLACRSCSPLVGAALHLSEPFCACRSENSNLLVSIRWRSALIRTWIQNPIPSSLYHSLSSIIEIHCFLERSCESLRQALDFALEVSYCADHLVPQMGLQIFFSCHLFFAILTARKVCDAVLQGSQACVWLIDVRSNL